MAVTITGREILSQSIRKGLPGTVLLNAEITSLSTTVLTSVLHFRNGNYHTNTFRDKQAFFYWPANSAAVVGDYVRSCGDLNASTGAITLDTALSAATLGSTDVYILDNGLHPSYFRDALNVAMRRTYFENMEPLSLAADAGFQSTATSSYTESDADAGPATTLTKVTTADSDNVFTGIASGRVLNAATDGYIRQRFNVTPGKQVYVACLARADVGTCSLTLYDVTNSAEIGSPVQHTGENWGYLWRTATVPSTCEVLEVRLQGEESNADIYYSGLWVSRIGDRRVKLSTTWDTAFKIPALVCAKFGQNVGNGVEDAFSIDYHEIPRTDYDFLFERPGANPYALQWHTDQWMGKPVYIQGRRAYGDLTTFTLALSETTACDLDLITAATLTALFEDERVAAKQPNADQRAAMARRDLSGQAAIHQTTGPALRRERISIPRLGN
jgi:hypothetical protein